MAEVLSGFECIRVDVDAEKEIAARWGAKAMPDLRLCDPDGHELTKLLGFVSAERLVRECTAVTDRLAGKPVRDEQARPPRRDVAVTPAAIDAAVAAGAAFLEQQAARGLSQDGGVPGLGDAVLLALACAGRSSNAATVALRDAVLAAPLTGIYQGSFRAMALARLDARAHRKALEDCGRFLADNQFADGTWSYAADPKATGDHSNSAYALLGLDACARAGIEVPKEIVRRAERAWRSAQNADGGFGYRRDREADSYASMTASALASLALCRRLLHDKEPKDDAAIGRGVAWLTGHFAVDQNTGSSYQAGRLLYHLYAVERAGTLLTDALATTDWYARGAGFLLGTQRDDGAWDDGADMPAANTVFALLFLTRATKQP